MRYINHLSTTRPFALVVLSTILPIVRTATIEAQAPMPLNQLRTANSQATLSDLNSLSHAVDLNTDAIFSQSTPVDFQPVIEPGFFDRATSADFVGAEPSSVRQAGGSTPTRSANVQAAYIQPVDDSQKSEELAKPIEKPADEPVDRLTFLENRINSEIESIKGDSQLDEATKSTRLNVLQNAHEWVQKTKTYQRKRTKFQADIDGFNEALKTAQEHLKHAETVSAPQPPSADRPTDELQRQMQQVQSELEVEKTERTSLHQSQTRYTQRITEVPAQKSEAQKRLKKIQERITEMTPLESDTHDESKLLQFAMKLGTTAEIDMLNVESGYLELASQLSPIRIDLANHKIKHLNLQYEQLKVAAEQARAREVEKQIQLARQAALDAHPRLAQLAKRNEVLAEQRKDIAKRIVDISEEATKVTDETQMVETELAHLQKKIDEGLTSSNTLLLAESHRQLISPLESQVRLSQLKSELHSVNLSVSELQDERESLTDPQAVIIEQLEMDPETINPEFKSMATEFVEARRLLLDHLLNDYRSYRRQIVETTVQRDKLIAGLQATRTLLNEHMLWVRSADPINLLTVKKSGDGLRDFCSSKRWSELVQRLADRARQQPYEYLMFTLGFAFLYGVVRRLKG